MSFFALLRRTVQEFSRHHAGWLAAAIAYYTIFSIAPLIIVMVEIAGVVLGQHQSILNEIYDYLNATVGTGASSAIQSIVTQTFGHHRASITTQIIGWAVFVIASVGLVAAFKQALNTIWDVSPRRQNLVTMVTSRLIDFAIVVLLSAILVASLSLNAALSAAGVLAATSPLLLVLLKVGYFCVFFVVIALVFIVVFEVLPDRRIQWRDVWVGALVTALLFLLGQALLAWYLTHAGISSVFGVFGSLIVFLLWTNYSAQIVLFGAEFTHVYAQRFGSQSRS